MRVALLFVLLLLLAAAPATAQESAVPITPVEKTVKAYRVNSVTTARRPDWRVLIAYEDDQGGTYIDEHYGPCTLVVPPGGGTPAKAPECAEDLAKQYNTANFSTNSMAKRTLEHLIAHGKIPPSTVQGTPETFTERAAPPPLKTTLPPPTTPKVKK